MRGKKGTILGEHNDLNDTFALIHLLGIIADHSEFEDYLGINGVELTREIFNGFVFLIKVVQRCFMEQIATSWSLNLEEDFYFFRAMDRGIHLSRLKNTCQKIVFLKNLHSVFQKCWKSRTKAELRNNLKIIKKKVLQPANHILENNIEIAEDFHDHNKREIIEALAIFYAFVFLNDTYAGYPKGYFCSILDTNLTKKYLKDVFEGYKLGLQFLWKKLLGDDYIKMPVSRLTEATNWRELDRFFRSINEETINPLENELKCNLAFADFFTITKQISISNEFDKHFFIKCKEVVLSPEEDLQQTLLWYPVQALSGYYVFSGVPAFLTTLTGSVELDRLLRRKERPVVIRFVHPEGGANRNSYSYGILVPAPGGIADYSGWLIFFDCATDYSGAGGTHHSYAELFINQYQKTNRIKVTEYKIDRYAFEKYLSTWSVEFVEEELNPNISKIPNGKEARERTKELETFYAGRESELQKLRNESGISKGHLLELIFFWYLTSKGFAARWRFRDKRIGEIDVLAKDVKNDALYLTSCMARLDRDKIEELAECGRKLLKYKKALPREFRDFKQLEKTVFTVSEPTPKIRKELSKKRIGIFSLDQLSKKDPLFSGIKKQELSILFKMKTGLDTTQF